MRELKKLLELSGLTQFQVSKISGVDRSRLCLALSRQIELRPKEHEAIMRALLKVVTKRGEQIRQVVEQYSPTAP